MKQFFASLRKKGSVASPPIVVEPITFSKSIFNGGGDTIYAGSYGTLSDPMAVYHNGATYIAGYRGNNTNNAASIFKYRDGVMTYATVGTVDNWDDLSHQHPTVKVIGGYIHLIQPNGHGQDIKIYRSTLPTSDPDDINNFVLIKSIAGFFGYNQPRMLPDGRMYIGATGRGGAGSALFTHLHAVSDTSDLTGTWTTVQPMNPDAIEIRHYPVTPFHYGTNEWFYIGIGLRRNNPDETIIFFGHAMYKTKDFNTFYNLNESWSWNIGTQGRFGRNQIEANLMLVGTNTDYTDFKGYLTPVCINDTIYSTYFDTATNYLRFLKVDPSGNITTYPCPIEGISTAQNFTSKMNLYYNGSNLILRAVVNGSVKIYTCDLNFQNINYRAEISSPDDIAAEKVNVSVLPWNMHEVSGEYIIGGMDAQNGSNPVGTLPYYTTTDKFLQ